MNTCSALRRPEEDDDGYPEGIPYRSRDGDQDQTIRSTGRHQVLAIRTEGKCSTAVQADVAVHIALRSTAVCTHRVQYTHADEQSNDPTSTERPSGHRESGWPYGHEDLPGSLLTETQQARGDEQHTRRVMQ